MSRSLAVTLGAIVVLAVLIGFLLGRGQAPSREEWERARVEARASAFPGAEERAFERARRQAFLAGLKVGRDRGAKRGSTHGRAAGEAEAQAQLAAIEAEREQEEAAALEYVAELPNGDPGYVLPEEERTISCIGYSAIDGECVGD